MPAESLNLSAQVVDYNKQPILILGATKADVRSAGWEVKGVSFLVTERRTRCNLGLEQNWYTHNPKDGTIGKVKI